MLNSLAPAAIPAGAVQKLVNARTDRGVFEGAGRYGDLWSRAGAHANDAGWGACLTEFQGAAEYLAVVQHNGQTTARLYSVNPSTGTHTAIAHNGSDALHASLWVFEQYEGYVYALNRTAGVWRRRVGGPAGSPGDAGYDADDAWRRFEPEFVRSTNLGLTTSKPPYSPFRAAAGSSGGWPAGTTTRVALTSTNYGYEAGAGAPDSQGRIELLTQDEPKTEGHSRVVVEVLFSTPQDFSLVDHIAFEVGKGSGVGPDNIRLGPLTAVWISEDTASTVTDAWLATQPTGQAFERTEVDARFYCADDFRHVPAAQRNAIRRLFFGFDFKFTWNHQCWIQEVALGGRRLIGTGDEPPEVEYAYAYFKPSTGQVSSATVERLTAGLADGSRPNSYVAKQGALVTFNPLVDPALYGQGWTKIRLYRKESIPVAGRERVWRQIAELDNSGSPSHADGVTEVELRELPEAALSFGSFAADLAAETLGVWKQHLALGLERRVYLSFPGQPRKFLPPPEQIYGRISGDETNVGATLYVGHGAIDSSLAFVGQDALYLVTARGVYAMVGDTAGDATPPRLLPSSRGGLGARCACRFGSGVAVAAEDGLWLYEVSRAFTGSMDGTMNASELTVDVRASWAELLGASSSEIVLAEHQDELWAFNDTRYMKLTRPGLGGRRHWEAGAWPKIKAAAAGAGRGLRVQLANGTLVKAGAYTTDLGAAVQWSALGGVEVGPRQVARQIVMHGAGSPWVKLRSRDGRTSSTDELFQAAMSGGYWSTNVHCEPGSRFWLEVGGVTGADSVERVDVVMENMEDFRS